MEIGKVMVLIRKIQYIMLSFSNVNGIKRRIGKNDASIKK
jgi:hypothetical protein